MSRFLLMSSLALALSLNLVACSDDDDDGGDSGPTGTIVITFTEDVDGATLVKYDAVPANIQYDNEAGNSYGVDLLEYLVTDFGVSGTSKMAHDIEVAHYRNAFDATTAELVLEDVPTGSYDTLSFWWGVPDDKNTGSVTDASVPRGLPGEFDFLLWPMGTAGGYHCMRFEGPYNKSAVGDGNFTLHMGRFANMAGTTTGHQEIALSGLDFQVVEDEELSITITMDVNAWMNDPEIDFTASAGGMPLDGPTMPNHAAQALMRDNATDVFSAAVN